MIRVVELIRKCFAKPLTIGFSNESVKVDGGNFNAARIWKLYGTRACKGDNTEERPHRRALIKIPKLDVTRKNEIVTVSRMEEIAALLPQVDDSTSKKPGNKINLVQKLDEWNIRYSAAGRWNNKAELFRLSTCPFSEKHDDGAYALQFDSGAFMVGCHRSSCQGRGWADLKEMMEPNSKDDESDDDNQFKKMIKIAEVAAYFKNDIDEACAAVPAKEHSEIYKVAGKKFKQWLVYQYYLEYDGAPTADAMKQAIAVLETKALHEGEERKLDIRVAESKGIFYYDLGDDEWKVVKISPGKWKIRKKYPRLFTRTKNIKPQLLETTGNGNMHLVDNHVRFKNPGDLLFF